MCAVEKWNNFAKKNIYINHNWEIGCGRLVFSLIVMFTQFFQIWWLTGNPYVFFALTLTLLTGLKKQDKNHDERD